MECEFITRVAAAVAGNERHLKGHFLGIRGIHEENCPHKPYLLCSGLFVDPAKYALGVASLSRLSIN